MHITLKKDHPLGGLCITELREVEPLRKGVFTTQDFFGNLCDSYRPSFPILHGSLSQSQVSQPINQCEASLIHLVDRGSHLMVLIYSFQGARSHLYHFHL